MNIFDINTLLILITGCGLFWLYIRSGEYTFSYKTALFGAGLLVAGIAIAFPSGPASGGSLFSMHMAKHVLLLMVAPPLMLAGFPEKPVQSLISNSGVGWLLKTLIHPVIAWILGVGIMWFWHAPPVYNGMMRVDNSVFQSSLLIVEIVSLIGVGLLFCSPILFPVEEYRLPALPGIAYLFTACVGCSILGILITFSSPGLYQTAFTPGSSEIWGLTRSTDQQLGGLLMWVPGCIIYVTGVLVLLTRWYSESENAHRTKSNRTSTI